MSYTLDERTPKASEESPMTETDWSAEAWGAALRTARDMSIASAEYRLSAVAALWNAVERQQQPAVLLALTRMVGAVGASIAAAAGAAADFDVRTVINGIVTDMADDPPTKYHD